ncbi:P-loop NTPase fold protein [Phenylobacterium sp.]|uniref:P-loop NTPase fold protein n=1 Tax=Phenylobacterium sp. TaxID=1871053 RepID=UPI0025F9DF98|nr:P-loop NTPase fold protein [Phenylobacterium sp.]
MTLIVDRSDEDGAQTHALVMGLGAYPNLFDNVANYSVGSALAFSNWLTDGFSNPAAPLATLDLVLSGSPTGLGQTPATGQEVTASMMAAAFEAWVARAARRRDNIALLYFCGHTGLSSNREALLFADDVGLSSRVGVIPWREVIRVLDSCNAERQVLFVDAFLTRRELSPFAAPSQLAPQPRTLPLRRGVFLAGAMPDREDGPNDPPSYFSQALMAVVQAPRTASPLNLGRLQAELEPRLSTLTAPHKTSQNVHVELTGDFDLHFPPEPAPAPKTAAKPAAPAKAARKAAPARKAKAAHSSGGSSEPAGGVEPNPGSPAANRAPSPPAAAPRPDLDFFDDDAELDNDALGRAGLAVMVARRLHTIWRNLNVGGDRQRRDSRASFVVHLDAPWGGGKTTFANFVARALNPYGFGRRPASFLTQRYGDGVNLSATFAQDPPPQDAAPSALPDDVCRPWIVVPFNAWQMEHCTPPWWAFYQVMHEASFKAIRTEGDRPASLARQGGHARPHVLARYGRWSWLWAREFAWRLITPKLLWPTIVFILGGLVVLLLSRWGVIEVGGKPGDLKAYFDPKTGAGLVMLALASLPLIGGALSLFFESLAPGVDPLAERLGLGHSDPFERFRRHFQHTMARIRRPVLVVVDDLDRCRPETIVDLVRGMQTILRSPRVVFLILGDRDWIERAFEARNADMAKVGGGVEQSLGARFVEKAIQMSFLLPGMGAANQSDYVRGLLERRGAPSTVNPAAVKLREKVREQAAARGGAAFDAAGLRSQARENWAEAKAYAAEARDLIKGVVHTSDSPAQASAEVAVQREIAQIINEELAIHAAAAPEVEAETAKRLQPLAPWLPPNPRQIKRILNGVALYHAVALQHPTFSTAGDRWFQLALWVVIMTEWPMTWRLLVACPEVADVLAAEAPAVALRALSEARLPGSYAATLKEVRRILADKALTALITGADDRPGPRLDTAAVVELLAITPPHGRPSRLADPPVADRGAGVQGPAA